MLPLPPLLLLAACCMLNRLQPVGVNCVLPGAGDGTVAVMIAVVGSEQGEVFFFAQRGYFVAVLSFHFLTCKLKPRLVKLQSAAH